jgi:hypothetical protein
VYGARDLAEGVSALAGILWLAEFTTPAIVMTVAAVGAWALQWRKWQARRKKAATPVG